MFIFLSMDFLSDGEIDLTIESKTPKDDNTGYVPAYKYAIALHNSTDKIGSISIRIGSNEKLEYGGQNCWVSLKYHQILNGISKENSTPVNMSGCSRHSPTQLICAIKPKDIGLTKS